MIAFRNICGVGGIDPKDAPSTQIIGMIMQWIIVAIVFWLLLQKYLIDHHIITAEQLIIIKWAVWCFFVIEMSTLTILSKRHWHYFWTNWLNFAIIILAFPLIWDHGTEFGILRIVRIIAILYLILPLRGGRSLNFSPAKLGIILLTFILLTLLAGLFLAYIDKDIGGPWQGVWWAFQTITTVGYGDVLPVTVHGRVFAILFMLLGVGLMATLSASFAYFLLRRKMQDNDTQKLDKLNDQIEILNKKISALNKKNHTE